MEVITEKPVQGRGRQNGNKIVEQIDVDGNSPSTGIVKKAAWIPVVVMVALSLSQGAIKAAEPKVENGLYHVLDSGGITVKSLDGKEIYLGKKLEDQIEKASLCSYRNDNSLFFINLTPTVRSLENPGRPMALYVDGHCLPFSFAGKRDSKSGSKPTDTIGEGDIPEVAADAFARFLKVTPRRRHHPHHELLVKFTPAKAKFKASEPIPVKLQIKNAGKNRVFFRVGGETGPKRDNQFGFIASQRDNQFDFISPEHAIPDIGSPMVSGGWTVFRSIKPGETFEAEVDLKKWFKFEKPGFYTLRGIYHMAFSKPDSNDRFTIWEDWATADFYLTISEK